LFSSTSDLLIASLIILVIPPAVFWLAAKYGGVHEEAYQQELDWDKRLKDLKKWRE